MIFYVKVKHAEAQRLNDLETTMLSSTLGATSAHNSYNLDTPIETKSNQTKSEVNESRSPHSYKPTYFTVHVQKDFKLPFLPIDSGPNKEEIFEKSVAL